MAGTRDAQHLQRLKGLLAAGRYSPNYLDQQGLCHIHHATFRGLISIMCQVAVQARKFFNCKVRYFSQFLLIKLILLLASVIRFTFERIRNSD